MTARYCPKYGAKYYFVPDYFKELSQYKGQTLITTELHFLVPTIKPELRNRYSNGILINNQKLNTEKSELVSHLMKKLVKLVRIGC
jgi:hypothetical protein